MSNKWNLPLAFCTLFVHLLLDVPSSSDAMYGTAARQTANLVQKVAQTVKVATKGPAGGSVRSKVTNTQKNIVAQGKMPKTTEGKLQKKAPNLPSNGATQQQSFQAMLDNYKRMAEIQLRSQLEFQMKIINQVTEVAKTKVTKAKEAAQKAKSHMLFGLDKLPEGVHQHAHLPNKLMVLNEGDKVSNAMQKLGKHMYDGIWRMSYKLKQLPRKTAAILAATFVFAEYAHTRDEWSQATLNPLITPDNVGFSLPRSMEEFKEGLINAALDILPDFAFALPVSLFVANPPAAILWAGWMAVGEYFAKKSWSLFLRDIVLPTENGEKFMELLKNKEVPVGRVFAKEGEEDDEDDAKAEPIFAEQEERGERSKGQKETVPIIEALADSQVNSNLYQYLFMNTLRAYYVTATSIYSHVMGEIEKAKDETSMTDLAKNVKQELTNPTDKKNSSKFKNWLDGMVRNKDDMLFEMEKDEQNHIEEVAKGITTRIVYTNVKNHQSKSEWDTIARIITEIIKTPKVMEEMVQVKLRGSSRFMPKDGISNDAGTNTDQLRIYKMDNLSEIDSAAEIAFVPMIEKEMVKKLMERFKKNVTDVKTTVNVVNKFLEGIQEKTSESAVLLEQPRDLKEVAEKVVKANNASEVLKKEGQKVKIREQNTVSRHTNNSGRNPMNADRQSKNKGFALLS
ncbi:hypothetical protein niasHT_023958 [Heterodera trifolii]|uniref:Uncharacterized protein n=1 Tax=Heterodera trifolii TaxID=157864 RepID=A0ABD2JW43_9BILA